MKHKIILGLLSLTAGLVTAGAADSTTAMPANHSAIVYEGRYATDNSGTVRLGFPGVTAHLRFRGKTVVMRANASNDDCYFDVSVDGGAPAVVRLKRGEDNYVLVNSEAAAEHMVVLTRRTESWMGTCAISNFDLPGGEWLPPPELPKRKLMFIGDSVTGGEMDAWAPGGDMHAKMNSNARVSYGMILARRFGAQCHLVSYGGRGIIRDWQGNRGIPNAPQFYELALPDDPSAAWDHRRYVPDAIGIQLGTNDFSQDIPDQNEFVNAYVEFIRKVRRDAPDALIFLMDSPILKDDVTSARRTVLHVYLEEIVKLVRSDKVALAPLSHYPGVPGNGHPTGQDHEGMAVELAPVFQRALGW